MQHRYETARKSEVCIVSLCLNVSGPDHLAPGLDLELDPLREFLRRARDHLVAERRQGVLQVRQRENLDDRAIKRGDDRFWRSGRDEDSDPTFALDIGVAGFGHRWSAGLLP